MQRDLKTEIIDVSYRMFKEKGFDNVTVQDICKELKITKPTFYNYIPSKDSLISVFFKQIVPELTEKITDMSTSNYYEQLVYGYDVIISHAQKVGLDLYRQLYISNLKENQGAFDFHDDLARIMTEIIRKGQAAGQILNTSPAEELYCTCSTLLLGYSVVWCLESGTPDLNALFKKGLDQILQINPESV